MSWFFWASHKPNKDAPAKDVDGNTIMSETSGSNANIWPESKPSRYYTTPQTIAACVATAAVSWGGRRVYKDYLRRIPNVSHLKPDGLRKKKLYGYVTSVGDGDNFRMFHTPGGRLVGWGWLPGRKMQNLTKKELQNNTIHVRIAGVDAPEMSHFGRPEQPYGKEALDWLKSHLEGRFVRILPYRKDQYERVVATVYQRRWALWKTDVGETMLRDGIATVYEAKTGSEFGDKEDQYRAVEKRAKEKKVGMWQKPGLISKMLGRTDSGTLESPREYKARMKKEEQAR